MEKEEPSTRSSPPMVSGWIPEHSLLFFYAFHRFAGKPEQSEAGKKKAKRGASLKDSSIVNFTLHFPAADFKEFSDYIHWRCLFKEECSKVGFLMDLAMDTIRKDRDYREFRKRNT